MLTPRRPTCPQSVLKNVTEYMGGLAAIVYAASLRDDELMDANPPLADLAFPTELLNCDGDWNRIRDTLKGYLRHYLAKLEAAG